MLLLCATAISTFVVFGSGTSAGSTDTATGPGSTSVQNINICMETNDATALGELSAKYDVPIDVGVGKQCHFVLLPNSDSNHELPPVYSSSLGQTISTRKCVIDYMPGESGKISYAIIYYIKQKAGSRSQCFETLLRLIRLGPSSITD